MIRFILFLQILGLVLLITVHSYVGPLSFNRLIHHYRSNGNIIAVASTTEVPSDVVVKPVKKDKKKTPDALEVLVIGLSHHNAKVEVREKLAIPEVEWNDVASQLTDYNSIAECAVLSTCNRFEIYIAGQNPYECMKDAIEFLIKRSSLKDPAGVGLGLYSLILIYLFTNLLIYLFL